MDLSERLLTVRNLRVRAGGGPGGPEVLRGVDLDIARGEILGLVGESGSGKTTTALAVLHLLPEGLRVSAGKVVFEGRDILALKPRELQDLRGNQIAMIFQDALRHLNPVFTVGEQIEAVVHAHHPELNRTAIRARATDLLEQVQIVDPVRCLKSYPHQFSGGMAQRAIIAMALAGHPDLLLADEPTSALDVTVQAEILRLLRRIARERHMAVLFISHNLSAVWQLCDRVCVMYAGQIVEESATATLVEQPAHPYTRALLQALPRLTVKRDVLASIPGMAPAASSIPVGCAFHPRCAHARGDCLQGIPPLIPFAEAHQVRCRYAGQLSA